MNSLHGLGLSRSTRQPTHLLHTPDTFVRAALPGMSNAVAIVHASPAVGAGFLEYTAELDRGGLMGATTHQRFVYVLEGEIELTREFACEALGPGGFAYLPAGERAGSSRMAGRGWR